MSQTERIRLDDGREVEIRPIAESDRDAERAFIKALSPQARRYRFLEQVSNPSEAMLDSLVKIDHQRKEAFVAIAQDPVHRDQIVGVSRYAMGHDPGECEMSLVVLDDYRPTNLKRVLLDRLARAARAAGARRMVSIDSTDNQHMREFAAAHGLTASPDPEDSTQVVYAIEL